ncbi:type IV secretion system protein [Candidatus Kaiserbacteria bacterium]|nr:MAG: type IV secretion system protein [Candidatus Kaiserbacteria bacterium]
MNTIQQKNKFLQGVLAFIFFVILCTPVAISFEKDSVKSASETIGVSEFSSIKIAISPTIAYAADKGKNDASGSEWVQKVVMVLGNLLLSIGAFFAWVTGNFLDKSLKELVFGMGDLINKGGIGIAIDTAWGIVRDLCNLAFIFGFIFLGIRTIIDPDNSSVKRTLSQIIIGAFLINFSLYMAKFIIDFSNFTAYSIYNAMVTGGSSISMIMFDQLGITTFYSTKGINTAQFAQATGDGMIAFYIMGMILLLVASFIFLASTLLLVSRFVLLVFLMIGSPILFAATVFPKTEGYAKLLWGKLLSLSFFAPLYLLLTLISMMMLKSFVGVMSGGQQFASTFTDPNAKMDAFGVVVSFVVVIYFLIQSLLIAKQLGVAGADRAIGLGKTLKGNAQSLVGRTALGWGGNKIAKWQENARYNGGAGSKAAARAARWTGVDAAANAAANAKWGGSKSSKETASESQERGRKHARAQQVSTISTAVSESTHLNAERERIEKDTSSTQAQKDAARTASDTANMRMESALAGASSEQTLELLRKHKSGPERDAIVANLSASQFDGLMKAKPEDLDDGKKEELRGQRSTAVQNRLIAAEDRKRKASATPSAPAVAATIQDVIGKADGKDLDAMGFDTVLSHAGQLSTKQVDDMSLTPTAKTRLKDARKAALIAEFNTGGAGAGAGDLFKRITSETERAKLPGEILKDSGAAPYLTQQVLTKMLDNESVLASDRAAIKTNVETAWLTNPTKARQFADFFDDTPAGKQYV